MKNAKWGNVDLDILHQLYKALEEEGVNLEILSLVGSWKDTLDDQHILELFKHYNETGTTWKEIYCQTEECKNQLRGY